MCKVCGNPASEAIQVKLHGAMEKNMYNNLELLERLQHATHLRPRRNRAAAKSAASAPKAADSDEEFSDIVEKD